jgi:hypothetical protein
MPSLSEVILFKPYIVLKESETTLEIEPQETDLMFGMVQLMYETNDGMFTVEDVVLFDPKDVKTIFKINFQNYYLIDENKILLKENPTLAP